MQRNTPRPWDSPPTVSSHQRDTIKFSAPVRDCSSYRGQTAIYGSTNRQTAPRRRQPRPARLRLAGTAPYGHPPLPENCPVENLSYPGSSGNRDVAGGLGAAPPVMRTGGAVASRPRNSPYPKKAPAPPAQRGLFSSHGPRKRLYGSRRPMTAARSIPRRWGPL
nr:unnamed protein product [uncultured bacterium]